MARKDDIFQSFMEHYILTEKYGLNASTIPSTVGEGMKSKIPIIKAIALIVEGSEAASPLTDSALRVQIIQFLNEAS